MSDIQVLKYLQIKKRITMYQTLSSGVRETGPQEKGKSLGGGEDLEVLSLIMRQVLSG